MKFHEVFDLCVSRGVGNYEFFSSSGRKLYFNVGEDTISWKFDGVIFSKTALGMYYEEHRTLKQEFLGVSAVKSVYSCNGGTEETRKESQKVISVLGDSVDKWIGYFLAATYDNSSDQMIAGAIRYEEQGAVSDVLRKALTSLRII